MREPVEVGIRTDSAIKPIDFISGKLNGDINVTSPTGLKTHFELSGNNLAKIFWNELI